MSQFLDAGAVLAEAGEVEVALVAAFEGMRGRNGGILWRWKETRPRRGAPCEGQSPGQAH